MVQEQDSGMRSFGNCSESWSSARHNAGHRSTTFLFYLEEVAQRIVMQVRPQAVRVKDGDSLIAPWVTCEINRTAVRPVQPETRAVLRHVLQIIMDAYARAPPVCLTMV